MKKISVCVLACLLLASNGWADPQLQEGSTVQLKMKNGQVVQGKVTTSRSSFCTIGKEDGTVEVVNLSDVAKARLLEDAPKETSASAAETGAQFTFDGPGVFTSKTKMFQIELPQEWKAAESSGQVLLQGPDKETQIILKYQYSQLAERSPEEQKKALQGMATFSSGLMQMASGVTMKNQGETSIDSGYAYRSEMSLQSPPMTVVNVFLFRAGHAVTLTYSYPGDSLRPLIEKIVHSLDFIEG